MAKLLSVMGALAIGVAGGACIMATQHDAFKDKVEENKKKDVTIAGGVMLGIFALILAGAVLAKNPKLFPPMLFVAIGLAGGACMLASQHEDLKGGVEDPQTVTIAGGVLLGIFVIGLAILLYSFTRPTATHNTM